MSIGYILLSFFAGAHCVPVRIEQFSSQSFVPEDIKVTFSIEQRTHIDYNLTIEEPFPGKILMNVFVRRLPDAGSTAPSRNYMKFRNMDFCKALESLRNLTTEQSQGVHLIPKTFLSSCPLIPGFYYLKSAVLDLHALPNSIADGRYFLVMELLQVYEEVTLLLNVKMKVTKHTPEGASVQPILLVPAKQSDEEEEKEEEEENDDAKDEKKGDENESNDEAVTKGKEDEEGMQDDRQTEGDDDDQSANAAADQTEEQQDHVSAEGELEGGTEPDGDNDKKQEEEPKNVEGEQQDKGEYTEEEEEEEENQDKEEPVAEAVSEA